MIPANSNVWILGDVVVTDFLVCAEWWIFVAYFFGANPVKILFKRSRHSIDRNFGGAFFLFGMKLALGQP